jgi:hypothetical protein
MAYYGDEYGIDPYETQKLDLKSRSARYNAPGVYGGVGRRESAEATQRLFDIEWAQQQKQAKIDRQNWLNSQEREKNNVLNQTYQKELEDMVSQAKANERNMMALKEKDYLEALNKQSLLSLEAAKNQADSYRRAGIEQEALTRNIGSDILNMMNRNIRESEKGSSFNAGLIKEATARSQEVMRRGVELANKKLAPWRQKGLDALGKLSTGIQEGAGKLTEDAGYKFRLAQGEKALDSAAAARGNLLSGAAVKAAMRYSQGLASEEYDKFHQRYMDKMNMYNQMSQAGMSAAGRMGEWEMQGAKNLGDYEMQGAGLRSNIYERGLDRTTGLRERGQSLKAQYDADATRYKTDAERNVANIMAAQSQANRDRMQAYNAWKAGNTW